VDDATCDCGQSTCIQTDTTLTAIKNIVVGTCGRNKCDFADMGPPSIATYNVRVYDGPCRVE